ncbi:MULTISPECIES: branched-chain amino acid ABC transporter substrate-binding protein [unclassified Mesorhizobium]|uniref:branched-chain amino acid ABC transporter substrate-binding protein n=1 Tax=unclassified Mesorhizobium TaxID=325217 RepID=UPI000BB06BA5|nr:MULTISPECIES: branched-chain amino acid ABC transporter substrate-binding protein [unclassified Mesorhizobium]TGT53360.1 ABC transporter substrate-binding protein [Mesorhizobium sp. M00.F.Ca.ET.170.01.1.1]AZO12720.1 ABC transporter substrate-binding protein [Mesorhizobium sp. M3A.F.Ca.ET.080.04.2.1]PBB87151.1 branched-chain amino acid ABC transporter substrate-binding protein [Mesorhizobium sp. WSM3876]RWB71307.1 MAG: ABC transporter substrate-binding protein [Mesorhizobium sp.]RWB91227.1 M
MRHITTTLAALFWLSLAASAHADGLVGVAAPLSGPSAVLGKQIENGASPAAQANGLALKIVDDACTADGGTAAARQFVDAKVDVVVGFLCTEAIEAALPILKDANIPVITVGVRTESLTDRRAKTGWPVYRLGPRGDDERNAAATILTRLWKDDLFAIVDDGTIYGREMAETLRAAAEQAALKPVFVDTFRPQLDNQIALIGRLKRAGATKVFAGGDGDDIAIMGRDAGSLNAGITFAGGENLRTPPGEVPFAPGTLMIAPPEWAEIADQTVVQAFAASKIVPEGYTLPAYAAVEIAKAALADAQSTGKTLAETLTGHDFETAIGTIRFDEKGDLTQNPFRVYRFDGTHFVPLEVE